MDDTKYQLYKCTSEKEIPYDLLLLADETIEAINAYITDCDVYLLRQAESTHPFAVAALYKIDEKTVEIKNIAVSETFQSKGIGKYLMDKIKEIAREQQYQYLIVGTSDSGFRQLNFYRKNGFKEFDVRKNFYTDNYPEPIIENGYILRDMILLKSEL